jgi:hypothetical protein
MAAAVGRNMETTMSDLRRPYVLIGFRTDTDGQHFATLAPYRQDQDGAEAVEVPCPRAVMKLLPHMQKEWARMEAEKRNLNA